MMPISACKLPGSCSSNSASGFTLLELLLVLTIIAMASILVVPNVGNLDASTFSAQVRQANSLLNYARRIAVVRGHPSTATFISSQSELTPEQLNASRDSVGNWESAGASIRYRDSTDQEIEVEDKIEITFYPEGGSTGGTLYFMQGDQEVRIYVDPFTGRIETLSDDQED